MDKVEWALAELLLLYCSFSVDRKHYCSKGSIEKLKKRIRRNIGRVYAKSQKAPITVTNVNALDLLKEYCECSNEKTFLYIDPPYRLELCTSKQPLYRHVLTEEQQKEMLSTLQNAKCPILLSGYKSEKSEDDLYCRYLDKKHGWVCLKLGDFHKSSSGKKGSIGTEYVWLNYFDRLPENAKYFVSMKNHGLEKGGACNE